jgi:hypothetical protein
MALRINRVRAVAANDAGFCDLLAALPEGVGPCLCCRRRSPDSPALILVADESDDDPRVLCAAVCSMCSTAYPADQLLANWVEQLVMRYGGTDVPDRRFAASTRPTAI